MAELEEGVIVSSLRSPWLTFEEQNLMSGGFPEFDWDDIKGDKHKEYYLGEQLGITVGTQQGTFSHRNSREFTQYGTPYFQLPQAQQWLVGGQRRRGRSRKWQGFE